MVLKISTHEETPHKKGNVHTNTNTEILKLPVQDREESCSARTPVHMDETSSS